MRCLANIAVFVGLLVLLPERLASQTKDGAVDGAAVEYPAVWRGDWISDDGEFRYSFVLSLVQTQGSFVEGSFEWTLEEGPPAYRSRIGDAAVEWVNGRELGRRDFIVLVGHAVSDSTLIAADAYRLVISGEAIGGSTRGNDGQWLNVLAGVRVRE